MVVMHQRIQAEFFQALLPVFMYIQIGQVLGILNLEISYDNFFYGSFIHSGAGQRVTEKLNSRDQKQDGTTNCGGTSYS